MFKGARLCNPDHMRPSSTYPTWRKLSHYLFLFQPSVACVDRSFSFLRLILLRPGMAGALVDLIEGTLMEMYNKDMSDAELLEELILANMYDFFVM